MEKQRHIHIYKKIYILLLLSIILSSSLVGVSAYKISSSILTDKMQLIYRESSLFITETVQRELTQIEQLADYIFFDDTIKNFLNRTDHNSYSYIKQQEQIEIQLKNYLYFSAYSNFQSVQLYDNDNLVLSLPVSLNTLPYDKERIYEDVRESCDQKDFTVHIKNNGEKYLLRKNDSFEPLLTIIRPIPDVNFRGVSGGMFITLSPHLFSEINTRYNHSGNQKIYILSQDNQPVNSAPDAADQELLSRIDWERLTSSQITLDDSLIFCYPLSKNGWKLVSIFPRQEMAAENKIILLTTGISFLTAFILTSLLGRFLFQRIFRPLEILHDTVYRIQNGETDTRIPVLSSDEIGSLSRNFNYMLDQLEQSHEQALKEQQKVKDSQYRALQASINPHFLYNTLNTIRWMAVIQKADNIKAMVETLVRLLRSTVNSNTEEHCIGSELDTLKDYLFIQGLAYSQHFSTQWEVDESLSSYRCIPFILQPLVENAIFHGLAPRTTAGIIRISSRMIVWQERQAVEIEVWDNGIGMAPDKVKNILQEDSYNKYNMSGIGINNVNERLILTYGTDYGLQISSKENDHTSIRIHIPVPVQSEE